MEYLIELDETTIELCIALTKIEATTTIFKRIFIQSNKHFS